jgi:hypothetical protein
VSSAPSCGCSNVECANHVLDTLHLMKDVSFQQWQDVLPEVQRVSECAKENASCQGQLLAERLLLEDAQEGSGLLPGEAVAIAHHCQKGQLHKFESMSPRFL